MTSRKRPTTEDMAALINQPHFEREDSKAQPGSAQAAAPTPMLIDVEKLVAYDRNPRRVANETYDQIKASIRVSGLDQVLTVTQRPDAPDSSIYMIAAGGNTRLAALKELYQETGDPQFAQVWCQFRPWQNDTHTLLAHIRENELRSDLTLIDRALAIRELRDLLEAETGERLSQRAFRDALRARGYSIGRTMIGWYDYAVDTLYPHVPTLLQGGIGRHSIAEIHKLQRGFAAALRSLDPDTGIPAADLFGGVLARHDSESIDLDALRRDLEEELSMSADIDVHRASLELGAQLDNSLSAADQGRNATSAPPENDNETTGNSEKEQATTPATTIADTDAPASNHWPSNKPVDSSADTTASKQSANAPHQRDHESTTDDSVADTLSPASEGKATSSQRSSLPADPKSLRSRAWTLASRLAQAMRLGDIVVPIQSGIGYLVGPISRQTVAVMHPDTAHTAICAWWHLATLSEQFAHHGRAISVMPEAWQEQPIGAAMRFAHDGDVPLARWQWTEGDRALFEQMPGLEPSAIGPALYRVWSDRQWQDWIALVETYRALYSTMGDAPWGDNDAH